MGPALGGHRISGRLAQLGLIQWIVSVSPVPVVIGDHIKMSSWKWGKTRTRVETKFLLLGYRGLSMQLPVWDIL